MRGSARRENHPAHRLAGLPRVRLAEVATVVTGIEQSGRRPVLLAGTQKQLSGYGGTARKVVDLLTTQDAHVLTEPPTRTWLIHFVVWLSTPDGNSGGAVANQTAEYSRHA